MKPNKLLYDLSNWRTLMTLSALLAVAISCSYYVQILPYTDIQASVLFPVSFFFASLLIYVDGVWKHKDMWLLLAAFLWTIVSFLANAYRMERALQSDEFISICVTLFILYPLAGALNPERRKRSFRFLASVNVFLISCLCIFALYCVIFDVEPFFPTLNGATIEIGADQRLCLFSNPNGGAIFCQVAASLCVYLILSTKNWFIRFFECIGFIAIYCVMSLMESKTANLALSVSLAMLAYLCITRAPWKCRKIVRHILAFGCAGIVVVACMYGFKGTQNGVNTLCLLARSKKPVLTAEFSEKSSNIAGSENRSEVTVIQLQAKSKYNEPAKATPSITDEVDAATDSGDDPATSKGKKLFADRKFFDNTTFTFNGRTTIWKAVLDALPQRPRLLLWGTSPRFADNEFDDVYPLRHVPYLHNSILCILVSYGVIGMLIWGAFLFNILVCGARVFFSKPDKTDLQTAFLMSLLVAILLNCMMESMLFNHITPLSMQTWMTLIGGYAVALNREWKQPIPISTAKQ